MKVSKAIEILNAHPILLKTEPDHAYFVAVKLGIEALKLLQYQRTYLVRAQNTILPGETPEEEAGSD